MDKQIPTKRSLVLAGASLDLISIASRKGAKKTDNQTTQTTERDHPVQKMSKALHAL